MECWIRMCFAKASERVKDLSHWASGQRKGCGRANERRVGGDRTNETKRNEVRTRESRTRGRQRKRGRTFSPE